MERLQNKVALITGGSKGIGAGIAIRLAQEGADVALTYFSAKDKGKTITDKIKSIGRKGLAIAADNSDPVALLKAVTETIAQFGRLDILVNNAGIFIAKPIADLTLEDFDRTVAINTRAAFITSQAAAGHMGENGRIVMIGSNLAERVPGPGLSIYSMSKAALTGLTKGLARDFGSRGITVNIIHPGSTDTDMNPADSEYADAQRSRMAIPRYGEPGDIASLVTWLASDESRFVTGAAFTIDGGANA